MTQAPRFETLLLDWYKDNARDLPWNKTKDPYKIWLSEIILQQTQVKQGLPYFERISQAFPLLADLAVAPQEDLLKLWEGLGYYSRARNLHKGAKYVMDNYDGLLPNSRIELMKIPGIGPYTSAAIASFAFSQNEAVVDGNVLRVMSRVFDLKDDIASQKTRRKVEAHAKNLISTGNSAAFNRAIMDLGATVCKPQNPKCMNCPLEKICLAKSRSTIDERPVNRKKVKKSMRYFCFFIVPNQEGGILTHQRTSNDIWNGLYQPPLLELPGPPTAQDIRMSSRWSLVVDEEISRIEPVKNVIHHLTHQTLEVYFYLVHFSKEGRILDVDKLQQEIDIRAFPIVVRRALTELLATI